MKNKYILAVPLFALIFLLPMISALGTSIVKKQGGIIQYVNAKTDIETTMNVLYFNHYKNMPGLSSGQLLVSGVDTMGRPVIIDLRLRETTVTETSTQATIKTTGYGSLQINGGFRLINTETVVILLNKNTGVTTITGTGNVAFKVTSMN